MLKKVINITRTTYVLLSGSSVVAGAQRTAPVTVQSLIIASHSTPSVSRSNLSFQPCSWSTDRHFLLTSHTTSDHWLGPPCNRHSTSVRCQLCRCFLLYRAIHEYKGRTWGYDSDRACSEWRNARGACGHFFACKFVKRTWKLYKKCKHYLRPDGTTSLELLYLVWQFIGKQYKVMMEAVARHETLTGALLYLEPSNTCYTFSSSFISKQILSALFPPGRI